MQQQRITKPRWPKGAWMKLANPEMLRGFMARRGVSYADLARSAGVSKGFISHLAKGRKKTMTPQVAHRIAERLDVDVDLLFVLSSSTSTGQNTQQRRRGAA